MLKPFVSSDWEVFSGVEWLESGPPLLARATLADSKGSVGAGTEITVVVARHHGCLMVEVFAEDGARMYWTFQDHMEFDAKAFAEFIAQGCMSWSGLRRLT